MSLWSSHTHTFSSKSHLHGDITYLPLQLHAPPVLQRRPLPSYSSYKLCSSCVSFQGFPHWPSLPGTLLFLGLNPALISTPASTKHWMLQRNYISDKQNVICTHQYQNIAFKCECDRRGGLWEMTFLSIWSTLSQNIRSEQDMAEFHSVKSEGQEQDTYLKGNMENGFSWAATRPEGLWIILLFW